jgi:hypothetical protein
MAAERAEAIAEEELQERLKFLDRAMDEAIAEEHSPQSPNRNDAP